MIKSAVLPARLLPVFLLLLLVVSGAGGVRAESSQFVGARSRADSGAQYEKLGAAFVAAINEKNIDKLVDLFDFQAFAYRAANTVFDNKASKDQFVKGFTSNKESVILQRVFGAAFKRNGHAVYLRTLSGTQPAVRIDYSEGGHEYIRLYGEYGGESGLQISDMFLLTSGRYLSETMGIGSQLLLQPSESLFKKLFGVKEINRDLVDVFIQSGKYREKGQYQQAYELLLGLPENIRQQRVILDTLVQYAQWVGEDEYRKQLALLDRYFGNEESAAFMLIDFYVYAEDYAKAQAAVDKIVALFGEDGALYNLKANLFYGAKDLKSAEKYARKGVDVEPGFEEVYWTLATILTDEKKYKDLVVNLKWLETRFGYRFVADNFTGNEFYSDFVKSAAYRNWLER